MSNKTQNEYINQIKDILHSCSNNEKAYKLIYQWVLTGKLKQRSLVEVMNYVENNNAN